MSSLPTKPSRSDTTTQPRPDPVLALLSVVLPLICCRAFSKEELVYVRLRIEKIGDQLALQVIERLGDSSDRIGNPIAAILGAAGAVRRDRMMRDEADRASADLEASRARREARKESV